MGPEPQPQIEDPPGTELRPEPAFPTCRELTPVQPAVELGQNLPVVAGVRAEIGRGKGSTWPCFVRPGD